MKFYFPKNIFTSSFVELLNDDEKQNLVFDASSVLSKSLNDDPGSVGLVPVLDLLSNKEFYVSQKFGLSFEGPLCNSYIYYDKNETHLSKIHLAGDVSSVEVLLAKILFRELYDTDCEIVLQTDLKQPVTGTQVLVGDYNFAEIKFTHGISFAEEMVEVLSAPYVNYVLASNNKEALEKYGQLFNDAAAGMDKQKVADNNFIPKESLEFIRENIDKVIFDFDEQDVIGIKEILQLPYYHGLINDITEIKFV